MVVSLGYINETEATVMVTCFARAFVLLPILAAQTAHGQVSVDLAKMTCEDFLGMRRADDIAIWLSGYYHRDRRDVIIDVDKLDDTVSKLRSACSRSENIKKPMMQVIEANLPK